MHIIPTNKLLTLKTLKTMETLIIYNQCPKPRTLKVNADPELQNNDKEFAQEMLDHINCKLLLHTAELSEDQTLHHYKIQVDPGIQVITFFEEFKYLLDWNDAEFHFTNFNANQDILDLWFTFEN